MTSKNNITEINQLQIQKIVSCMKENYIIYLELAAWESLWKFIQNNSSMCISEV